MNGTTSSSFSSSSPRPQEPRTTPSEGVLRQRVEAAAEAALKAGGSVGPLELFAQMRFLHPVHLEGWRRGLEAYQPLEPWIQVGKEKRLKTLQHFAAWAKERGLQSVQASYTRRTPRGVVELQVTASGDPAEEAFYRTHLAPGGLTERKQQRLQQKLAKVPDLVVFENTGDLQHCSECGAELPDGASFCVEKEQPLCLECADLDHLVFLPAGDTALSRRARKHSPLLAVVLRFNRRRKRHERQGVLITEAALEAAENECAADAPERAARRAREAVHRASSDGQLASAVVKSILQQFPGCPPQEARAIAQHTTVRGSGRVGRSAAGRELDPKAVRLAVIAHIRHQHTSYDSLLMAGTERLEARALVRADIDRVTERWMNPSGA